MKMKRKKSVLLGVIIFVLFTPYLFTKFIYEREMNQIESKLNSIENVEVFNIWGNRDITLEDISVRVKIKDKGELVLSGISQDNFNYPNIVPITEIGGYTFTSFDSNGGIGSGIDIGTNKFGQLLNIEFNSVNKVIKNYDIILNFVKNLKIYPEINYFETSNFESYLLVKQQTSIDQNPILILSGIENKFKFAKTLKWNRSDSYYN